MTDADPSRRGTDPLRPFEVHRLLRSSGMEPSGLDDVCADGAERLRDDVPMSQLRLGPLRLHEDDDARLVRLAAADHLVADPDPDHVRPGEDRGLVRGLCGAGLLRGHRSLLPLERADLEEAFAELPARGGPAPAPTPVAPKPTEAPNSSFRQ